jgi:cellulose biosynthesis protein BcsQ
MLIQPIQETAQSAHVVVLGNEKGGSGKSTTALHIAVALLKAGQRVATIDLDSRQQSFTHYIDNRRAWAERARISPKAIRSKRTKRRSSRIFRRRSARLSTAMTWL